MSQKTTLLSLAVLACFSPAFAGPVTEFEAAYGEMYAGYRSALFATNSGNAEKSAAALQGLETQWGALTATYGQIPPPQYEADPKWGDTIADVTGSIAKASEAVAKGNLPESHETLEGVREAFSALHARNGIETFSDRMNAYHAEMEKIIGLDLAALDAPAKQTVLEHAAVLAYLAQDVMSAPPASAEGNADYAPLSAAMQASVDQLLTAARAGDAAAIKAAVGGLKVPYSKFFLKFG
ncbi:MAG: hypothetical protein EON48_12535 [Acetobacteraceae bacterium]|nr:MAG: hypothetical protein EON48_12535 [Acetobacteraceae bacterium]